MRRSVLPCRLSRAFTELAGCWVCAPTRAARRRMRCSHALLCAAFSQGSVSKGYSWKFKHCRSVLL